MRLKKRKIFWFDYNIILWENVWQKMYFKKKNGAKRRCHIFHWWLAIVQKLLIEEVTMFSYSWPSCEDRR